MENDKSGSALQATHYQRQEKQPIEIMQMCFSKEEMLGYLKGNVFKYLLRAGAKGEAQQDYEKMEQYAKWLVTVSANGKIDPWENGEKRG